MDSTPPVSFIPPIGPDGIPTDFPVVAYTEKVLEEKELQLRKYIQDNYSKIRNVERELASLAWEVKLTAGPKKAALELLRKKIELSAEKIKAAKQKEEHSRKVWEAAAKVLKEEEENKQRLCEDLNRLVQESAAAQYSRLEELKQRLEALNPGVGGDVSQLTNLEKGSRTLILQPKDGTNLHDVKHESNNGKVQGASGNTQIFNGFLENGVDKIDGAGCVSSSTQSNAVFQSHSGPLKELDSEKVPSRPLAVGKTGRGNSSQALGESGSHSSQGQHVSQMKGRGRAKGSMILGKHKGNTWTGAGFDVDDNAING